MEREKRKREDDREMNGKRNKGKAAEAEERVTEEEVEEFFAILRRMQVAAKYFEKADNNKDAGGRKLTDTRWRLCFEAEDFDEHNGVNNNGGHKEEVGEEDSGLDLNSDPASSKNSH